MRWRGALARYRQAAWAVLSVALLLWSAGSAWRHWEARARLPAFVPEPAVSSAPAVTVNAEALDMLFGLSRERAPVSSAAPLALHASLVSEDGPSRALLVSGTLAQFYREGDRLPDGSVLRRIHTDRVLLWRNGREETLTGARPAARHFTTHPPVAGGRSLLQPLPTVEPRP